MQASWLTNWNEWFFESMLFRAESIGAHDIGEIISTAKPGMCREINADALFSALESGLERGVYNSTFMIRASLGLRGFAKKTMSAPADVETMDEWRSMLSQMTGALANWENPNHTAGRDLLKNRFNDIWS